MPDEERGTDEAGQKPSGDGVSADSGRLGDTFISVRQAFGRSFDRLTGAEFRRQFEEFSNVVATTVLGIHRDQSELGQRVDKIEQAQPSSRLANKLLIATLLFSLGALILSLVAILRTI